MSGWVSTRETVAVETPARRATCVMLATAASYSKKALATLRSHCYHPRVKILKTITSRHAIHFFAVHVGVSFTRWRAGMTRQHQPGGRYSRRDFGKLALAGLALPSLAGSRLLAASSKINGVQIGAITYSFRSIPDAEAIVKAMAQIGLSEAELMSNNAEQIAGAPRGRTARPAP